MKSLVGMFAIVSSPDGDSFYTAEIVAQVSPTHYMAQPHSMRDEDKNTRRPMLLVTLDQMTELTCDACGQHVWDLFEDEAHMRAYFEWIDAPALATVVKLHKNKH